MTAGTLYAVGVGPGDPELLTVKATRLIASADVIAYHSGTQGDLDRPLDRGGPDPARTRSRSCWPTR